MASLSQQELPAAFRCPELNASISGRHSDTLIPVVGTYEADDMCIDTMPRRRTYTMTVNGKEREVMLWQPCVALKTMFLFAPARILCAICHEATCGPTCTKCGPPTRVWQLYKKLELVQNWLPDECRLVGAGWRAWCCGRAGRFARWARTFVNTGTGGGGGRKISVMVPPRWRLVQDAAAVLKEDSSRYGSARGAYLAQPDGVPQESTQTEYDTVRGTLRIAVFDQQRTRNDELETLIAKYNVNLYSYKVVNFYTSHLPESSSMLRSHAITCGYDTHAWVITTAARLTNFGGAQDRHARAVAARYHGYGDGKYTQTQIDDMGVELLKLGALPRQMFGFSYPPTELTSHATGSATTVLCHGVTGSFRHIQFVPMTMDFLFDREALDKDFPGLDAMRTAFADAFRENHKEWTRKARGIMIQYQNKNHVRMLEVERTPMTVERPGPDDLLRAMSPATTVFVIFWADFSTLMAEWRDRMTTCGRGCVMPNRGRRQKAFDTYDEEILVLLQRPGLLLHRGRTAYAVVRQAGPSCVSGSNKPPYLTLLKPKTLLPQGLLCWNGPLGAGHTAMTLPVGCVPNALTVAAGEAHCRLLGLLRLDFRAYKPYKAHVSTSLLAKAFQALKRP